MTDRYLEAIEDYLTPIIPQKPPVNLYEPVRYILSSGGKRIRPVLVMLAAEGYGFERADALPAAAAIEIFHNFTLLHDDIMDHAKLRRGKPTVHIRWDPNIAILSGDAMVYLAQQQLEHYQGETYKALQTLFNRTALEICEGQQEDMDFEKINRVSVSQYMEMIRKKTAVLLGTSLAFGAILAGCEANERELLYQIGIKTGLAFQMMDDWLDTFGDESFGKKTGGDIRESKKTVLYVKTLELLNESEKKRFIEDYTSDWSDEQAKIDYFRGLFEKTGVKEKVLENITELSQTIIAKIEQTRLQSVHQAMLKTLIRKLSRRQK